MAKDNGNHGSPNLPPPGPSPQEKAKAEKWFDHAKAAAEKSSYDYAIECYINGLRLWPEAVDEGHKPLRAVGFARLGAGKKKPGMFETMKFQTFGSGRDALEAMLTAEMLLAKDPTNLNYMEAALKSAHKGGYENTCLWLGPFLLAEALTSPKANLTRLSTVIQVFDALANKFGERGDVSHTVQCLEVAAKAIDILIQLKPDDRPTMDLQRNLGGKLAIIKGKFETGDFRESLLDGEKQRDLYDQDRLYQNDSRYEELIGSALKSLEANPNELGKVVAVTDLMLKRGRIQDEEAAIHLLLDSYTRTRVYQYKLRADEIRIRQLRRQAHHLKTAGDRQAALEHVKNELEFEIGVYKERIQQYPTEARYKYELGKRYFIGQRYDEAVPILQQARGDPKHRMPCQSLIAQCFFQKGYHNQAVNVLLDAIKAYEIEGDDIAKELHYWLGRSHEASGQMDAAIQTYGRIIQWDYNYRNGDVRQRLESLQQARKNDGGQ